jgi:hypothetical protein
MPGIPSQVVQDIAFLTSLVQISEGTVSIVTEVFVVSLRPSMKVPPFGPWPLPYNLLLIINGSCIHIFL